MKKCFIHQIKGTPEIQCRTKSRYDGFYNKLSNWNQGFSQQRIRIKALHAEGIFV